jgi:DDE family transposase
MINDFNDFCTWVYVIVDDIWLKIAPFFKRPGPAPECPDSELLAMALIGECRGWDLETEMLSHWQEHRDLFPVIPTQSRFNRRRRSLLQAFNLIRRVILQCLDVAQDRQCVVDSLPLPMVQFRLVPFAPSSSDWKAYGSTFFGYKLHLLIAMNGVILDFELAPANEGDLEVGFELLAEHTDLHVLGDKAYISAEKAVHLWQQNRIKLTTIPRRNQQKQLPHSLRRLYNSMRQIIETVNAQLSSQFHIEVNHAHSFWGLCTRLYTKLAAHTLCIYLNRLTGKPAFLQIKALAFPI